MRLVLLLLLLGLGLLLGYFARDVVKNNFSLNPSPPPIKISFDTSNNLRVDLNSVYRENVILLTSTLRRIYNKEPYAPDATEALYENTQRLADIIGKYYKDEAKSEFLELWKNQNRAFISYTEAIRDKDDIKKAEAEGKLNGYIESSLTFWNKTNPKFEIAPYRTMLTDRVNFIKNFVTDLNSANVAGSYKEQHNAYQQIGKIADFLTLNIVKQFPERFK